MLEAIPLKSIDAAHVAEALVTFFSRVGILSEILTDQGSSFTSQLLMEIYRLLHVHLIWTTPYHPQTDWLKGSTSEKHGEEKCSGRRQDLG